jgi:oligopeptide transport system substrate-binding protein
MRKEPETFPQLLYFGSWYQDYPDPQNWLSTYWTCDSSLNRSGYCNEEFDVLTAQGDTTIDPAERKSFYEQAGQMLVDDVPAPFLYNPLGTFIVNPAVTGYTATAIDSTWPGYATTLMTIEKVG